MGDTHQQATPVDRYSNLSMSFGAAVTGAVAFGTGLVKMDMNEMQYGIEKAIETSRWGMLAISS